MDSRQSHIDEFIALSSKKKPTNTGTKPNNISEVIIIDCSDDSDCQEMESITCLSISADVPVQRLEEDIENEEETQLVPQVSTFTHQSSEQFNEETVDASLSCGSNNLED